MKKHLIFAIVLGLASRNLISAATCFVDAMFVPAPKSRVSVVRVHVFDGRQAGQSLGNYIKSIKGRTWFKEPVTTLPDTQDLRIVFEIDTPANSPKLQARPKEVLVKLDENVHVRDVTWIPQEADPNDIYLKNIASAHALLRKNPDEALARATYSRAIAQTANQKVEAAKIQAKANIAQKRTGDALDAFSSVAEDPAFERADKSKKKAFVKEWFDATEVVAKSEGARPDKETGLVFASAPQNSNATQQLEKLKNTLSKVDPTRGDNADQRISEQTQALGSKTAATENVVREQLSRGAYSSSR